METECGLDPETQSFCEEGEATMNAALASVKSAYAARAAFRGVAVHHYATYRTLSP